MVQQRTWPAGQVPAIEPVSRDIPLKAHTTRVIRERERRATAS